MTRLQAVAVDLNALVDAEGRAYPDAAASLLAAREAGLRVVVVASDEGSAVERALDDLAAPVDEVAITNGAPRRTIEAVGLRPEATLRVVAEPAEVDRAAAAGIATALVDRCGRCASAAPTHRWRDLLGLIALCRATPRLSRSAVRC